jgi:hypothetical protein
MGRYKIVDGVKINFTPEEETARDIEEKAFADEQAERAKVQYKRNRKREYPSIEECVHAILDNELDALQVKRQAVKKKYPKENN